MRGRNRKTTIDTPKRPCTVTWYKGVYAISVGAMLFCSDAAYSQQPGSGAQAPLSNAGVQGTLNGHIGVNCNGAPTPATATLDDGSDDCAGSFVATAGTASLTFSLPFMRPPFCVVGGQSVSPVYRVFAAQIIFDAVTSGSRYHYTCSARPGG